MTILDRNTPPPVQPLHYKALPPFVRTKLSGGMPAWLVNYGVQPVVEVQLVFRAGAANQQVPGLAALAASMLSEGSRRLTNDRLAEEMDACGAYMQLSPGIEHTTLSLSTLTRTLPRALALVRELLTEPGLREADWAQLKQRQHNQLQVEHRSTAHRARQRFMPLLFGAGHPYATTLTPETLDALSLDQVAGYTRQLLCLPNAQVLAAGVFNETELLNTLQAELGAAIWTPQPAQPYHYPALPAAPAPGLAVEHMEDNLQCTLRVGHRGASRLHPHYHRMRLTNMLLGGYFGSRLMTNIREEKGYTYGISCQWASMVNDGYFIVGTDVGNEFVADTLKQIQLEIERLHNDLVPEKELETARAYLLGQILNHMETPFQVADILKSLAQYGLPPEDLQTGFETIATQTAEDVRTMAQTWLHPDQLVQVVAGSYMPV